MPSTLTGCRAIELFEPTGHGLFEPLAGDGVDAALGRGGDDLVAALTQNDDGLRADQAGAADHNDLHSLPPCQRLENLEQGSDASEEVSGPRHTGMMQPREETHRGVPTEHAARRVAHDVERIERKHQRGCRVYARDGEITLTNLLGKRGQLIRQERATYWAKEGQLADGAAGEIAAVSRAAPAIRAAINDS